MMIKSYYPRIFANRYKTTEDIQIAQKIWHTHLSNFEDQYIKLAIESCIDKFPEDMPEIGEFKRLVASFLGDRRYPEFKAGNIKMHSTSQTVSTLLENYCIENNIILPGVMYRGQH